jgi:hypothetical protein
MSDHLVYKGTGGGRRSMIDVKATPSASGRGMGD